MAPHAKSEAGHCLPCISLRPLFGFIHCCFVLALLVAAARVGAAPYAYLADRADNTVSVLDIADYRTIATLSLGPPLRLPSAVAMHEASGKVLIGENTGVTIIDARTNTITGHIPVMHGVSALAVAQNGSKAYALGKGRVNVIDLLAGAVAAGIVVNSSASGIAIDHRGENVYLAHSGSTGGLAGLTIIDAKSDTIKAVLSSTLAAPGFQPRTVAVNPTGNRVYLLGDEGLKYLVFDVASHVMTEVVLLVPEDTPPVFQFTRIAFNRDGSRLFLGGNSAGTASLPVFEIDAATDTVSRVLLLASGFADSHSVADLFTSYAENKFVLGISLREHMHTYPHKPPRRIILIDGRSGSIQADLGFAAASHNNGILGAVLDK